MVPVTAPPKFEALAMRQLMRRFALQLLLASSTASLLVSTPDELLSAINDTSAADTIVLAASGSPYYFTHELYINRNVSIVAEASTPSTA